MKILLANRAKGKGTGVNPTEQLIWSSRIPFESASRIPAVARAWAGALGGSRDYQRRSYLGLLLEFATVKALLRLGIGVYYPSSPAAWRKAQGQAADAVLIADGVQIECKNWGTYKVSPELVRREILSRFHGEGMKVIVISTLKGFTNESRQLLTGITVVEVGFKISEKNVLEAIKILECRLAAVFGVAVSRNMRKFGYLLDLVGVYRCDLSPTQSGVSGAPAGRLLALRGCVPRAGPCAGLGGATLKRPGGHN